MNRETFETLLGALGAKADKAGAFTFPDGAQVTVHVARAGGGFSASKVESLTIDGPLVVARSAKQVAGFALEDVLALSAEGTSGGSASRKPAGFG